MRWVFPRVWVNKYSPGVGNTDKVHGGVTHNWGMSQLVFNMIPNRTKTTSCPFIVPIVWLFYSRIAKIKSLLCMYCIAFAQEVIPLPWLMDCIYEPFI